jgi:hypothetical protein
LAEATRFRLFFLPSGLCGFGGVVRKCRTTFSNSGSFVGSALPAMTPLGPDGFYSAKLRIERAKEHLNDLEAQINSFFGEKPYTRVVEPDPNGTHEIHKLRLTKPFPFRWRILATEIIEHLRASLDHATWATGYLSTRNPDIQQVAFPFGETLSDLDNSMRRRSKNLPPEIQALLRTFQPYKGGNDLLFDLNDMCNLSKHALIAFIANAIADGEIRGSGWAEPIDLYDPLTLDRAKNEIPYARVRRSLHFDHEIKISIYPAIEHRETTSAEPAIAVLDAMGSEVRRIVLAIEAESRKIGLIK